MKPKVSLAWTIAVLSTTFKLVRNVPENWI